MWICVHYREREIIWTFMIYLALGELNHLYDMKIDYSTSKHLNSMHTVQEHNKTVEAFLSTYLSNF